MKIEIEIQDTTATITVDGRAYTATSDDPNQRMYKLKPRLFDHCLGELVVSKLGSVVWPVMKIQSDMGLKAWEKLDDDTFSQAEEYL